MVAFRHALGHLGSGQPRRVGGDAVQVVADAVVGVLPAGEVVARKAQVLVRGQLHNAYAVGGKGLGVGVGAGQGGVQHTVVAALQRVAAARAVVEPDVDTAVARFGFQLRVGGQGTVQGVHLFRLDAAYGAAAGRAPLTDSQGQQRRRADNAKGERRTQHGQPVKLDQHIGLGAVHEHFNTQHDEDNWREFYDLQ